MENQFYSVVDYYADNKKVSSISMENLENIDNPKLFWDEFKARLKKHYINFLEIDDKIIYRSAIYDYAVHYLVEYSK